MRFVIAAGGTGGHLFPGLAVGEVFVARGHEVMLLISEKAIDATATEGRTEFRIEKVSGEGLQSKSPLAMWRFLWKLGKGIRQCKRLYREWSPAAVLGMGGFTCFAPIYAGRKRGLPTFVHESNAIPGRANKLNARYVTRVLLGFDECAQHFPKAKCEVTGTPVRTSLRQPLDKREARRRFGLAEGTPTLLVMGGSQGASGLNRRMVEALPKLKGRSIQVIHLSGKTDVEKVRNAYAEAGVPALVAAFHHAMQDAYAAADLAVARSGAASLTELSFFGVPAILIPYPFAADDHQTANALIFDRARAGILLKESEATGETLAQIISSFLDTPAQLEGMAERSRKLAPADAATRVADTILRSCNS
jgi:UDP-N-acetylglucosamine--N-acetylmuramyl-(pentapeptide) pyrophosphoryl-undecaprenol N-acetylglucosamine transferase